VPKRASAALRSRETCRISAMVLVATNGRILTDLICRRVRCRYLGGLPKR
jgi:hypothetical protein